MIDAFKKAKLENMHLKIIGNGPQLQNLVDLHKSDKNIIFYGSLSNQETMKIISKANCIVTATKLWEGQPTLLCEASFLVSHLYSLTQEVFQNFFQRIMVLCLSKITTVI